jgi:cytochrome P450
MSTDSRSTHPVEHRPAVDDNAVTASLTEVMSDLAAPQQRYLEMSQRGYVPITPGLGVSFDREDTRFITRNHEHFSMAVPLNLGNSRPFIPLNVDPPLHAKYRKLLAPAFTVNRMAQQERDIDRRVNGFIDAFIDRGECNFSDEFADPLPSSVFLGLMGLPEDELPMFLVLRDGILHPDLTDPAAAGDMEARERVVNATGKKVYEYFGTLVAERTRKPSDDIISMLLASEIDGERLSSEEIQDICFLFIIAGLDTVGDALTCAFAFLARSPQHRQAIVDDPSIIPVAVEELLRWESVAPGGAPRLVTSAVDLPSGAHLEKGSLVMPHWGAANVDPTAFGDPMDVRFDRTANPHFAFGMGIHTCIGAHLARREIRSTLQEWHRRIPDYAITPGHEDLQYPPGLRHVKNLMLSWS